MAPSSRATICTPDVFLDPYRFSSLVRKILQQRFISIMDLDGTLAAGSLAARLAVLRILEQAGALIFSTARSAELVLRSHTVERSRYAGGFKRPLPKWHYNPKSETYEFVAIETLPEFEGVLDPPDGIFAFGDNLYLNNPGWCMQNPRMGVYIADREYERRYLDPLHFADPKGRPPWGELASDLVRKVGAGGELAPIDVEDAFENGGANVARFRYRKQINLHGENAVERKYQLLKDIQEAQKGTLLDGRIEGVDESNPKNHTATLYLMPQAARKEDMFNHGLRTACRHARQDPSRVGVFIAGDSLTDFYQMCEAAYDSKVTGLVVGDRLAQCIEEKTNFAAVDLRKFHNALIPIPDRDGFYRYVNPHGRGGGPARERIIIVGNRAYPGTDGADTILACLKDQPHVLAPPG